MEAGLMMEDLLNFTLDVDHGDDRALIRKSPLLSLSESSDPNNSNTQDPVDHGGFPLPEFAEEELEWLNVDAFPEVETCLDILSDNPAIDLDHQSPVSVLDNGTNNSNNNNNSISYNGGILVPLRHPVKARSKLTRPRRDSGFLELPESLCWMRSQGSIKNPKQELAAAAPQPRPRPPSATTIGRRCQHCQAEKTPQWRAGPMGPKTLCNACGVRFKSGRLVPEYRPANSPTFSRLLHSNSHRQVMEMRRQKQLGEGMVFNEACGYKL